jgi:hypothetical protein
LVLKAKKILVKHGPLISFTWNREHPYEYLNFESIFSSSYFHFEWLSCQYRITKLEELAGIGSRLLNGYQQALGMYGFKIMLGHSFFSFLHFCLITLFCFIFLIEFLRRPPIDETSQLIKNIIKANETKRVKSYIEAGCINVHDSIQNTNKCKCKCNQYFTLPSLEFSILCLLVLFFCKTFWANCYALWHTEVHTCLLGLHNHLSKGNLFFSMLSNI